MKFKYKNFKNIIILFIIFSFISLSIYPSFNAYREEKKVLNTNLNDCYGFVIPLPESDIISENPEIQYSTMNLINDLLRLDIPVYWLKNQVNIKIREINDDKKLKDMVFNPGTFIIPFTFDKSIDDKLIAVIYDYNISHEIYENNFLPVKTYMILQSFNLKNPYKLIEPKIAYYYGNGVYSRSLNWYVYTLYKSGFLTNDFLYDEEVIDQLNFDDYNIFIWPGGEIIEDINSNISLLTRIQKQNKIRDFVANGGGYIGSCYGAFAASSGIRFLPFTLLNYYYPIIPSIGYLSIQDCTTALAISCRFNISISDINHPVIYGSDDILYDSQLRGGPVYTWLGKNTQSLATIKEINSTIWTHWFRNLFLLNNSISNKIIDLWVKFTQGKTIWTTSEYEKGKIVTFGDHPELGHINLNRIVHNSVFYVSSTQESEFNIDSAYQIEYLEKISAQSINISLYESEGNLFLDINDKLKNNIDNFISYNNRTEILYNKIFEMMEQNELNYSFAIEIFVSGFWEFITTINRSRYYLDNPTNYEDTYNNLIKLDSINNQMKTIEINDSSIECLIKKLKNNVDDKINQITDLNYKINNDLYQFENKIDNYENTELQNQSIIENCNNLWQYSKLIDRLCSNLYFESLKTLRESWYNYETDILMF